MRLDGLLLSKFSLKAPQRALVGLTKGEWSQRLAAFKSVFGAVPAPFLAAESELERMRRARNSIAHEFGLQAPQNLSISAASLLTLKADDYATLRATVGHDRLLRWLGVMVTAARAIENTLMPTYVGGFEIANFYVEWRRDPDATEKRMGIEIASHKRPRPGRFSDVVGRFVGPVGREYIQTLEKYLDSL